MQRLFYGSSPQPLMAGCALFARVRAYRENLWSAGRFFLGGMFLSNAHEISRKTGHNCLIRFKLRR
jgi:hypothetical protein